jgi:hypothetical protein
MSYASRDPVPLTQEQIAEIISVLPTPSVTLTSEQIATIASQIPTVNISGKVDKITGSSLLPDSEAAKIHVFGADNQDLSELVSTSDSRLIDARTPLAHAHPYDTSIKLILLADKPTGANVTPVTLGLSFNYEANSQYAIDIYAIVAPTAATTGCGFMIDVSSVVTYVGTFVSHQLAITGTLSGAASIGDLAATSSGVSSGMASTASQFVSGGGILVTGANTGTATFFFRSETTAVTTCKTGTLIKITKMNQ